MKCFKISIIIVLVVSGCLFAGAPVFPVTNGNACNIDLTGQNTATSYHKGSLNWGYINMEGTNYTSEIYRTTVSVNAKLGVYHTLIGSSNIARTEMPVNSSGAAIVFTGNGNEGYQYLGASGSSTTDWDVMGLQITATGSDNQIIQETEEAFGAGGIQGMKAIVTGSDNYTSQYNIGGSGSTMELTIQGSGNSSDTTGLAGSIVTSDGYIMDFPLDIGWADKPASARTVTPTTKTAPGNSEYMQYAAGLATVTVGDILGDDNILVQYSEYTDAATGGINEQYGYITGDSNKLIQGAKGENNRSEVTIIGNGNQVWETLLGNDCESTTSVIGLNNTVTKYLNVDFSTSDVTVNGSGAFVSVISVP